MTTTASEVLITFEVCECTVCGVSYGMTVNYRNSRRRDHKTWYCPNGDSQYFPGESEIEKAERLRKAATARAEALRDQLNASERSKADLERSRAALKGHLTRARNRIANGVCPVAGCHRHFDNVQAHMTTEHPTYRIADSE